MGLLRLQSDSKYATVSILQRTQRFHNIISKKRLKKITVFRQYYEVKLEISYPYP